MTDYIELRDRLTKNITLFSHDRAALLELVDAKIADDLAPTQGDPASALTRLYAFATKELRNTGQLMSNPPQSAAAWDIRNAISKEITSLGGSLKS
jgi:hypothetical protein